MLDLVPFPLSQMALAPGHGSTNRAPAAMQLYNQAYGGGRGRFWSALRGHPRWLGSLEHVTASTAVLNRHDSGLQTVPIEQIRGSEGRSRDFDARFHPLQARTRDRWVSIARARLDGATVPPVELIQVGDTYFVRDGHHRLSVARALGEEFVEAHVTVWTTKQQVSEQPWPMPYGSLSSTISAARARA